MTKINNEVIYVVRACTDFKDEIGYVGSDIEEVKIWFLYYDCGVNSVEYTNVWVEVWHNGKEIGLLELGGV